MRATISCTAEQKILKQSLELFIANVSLFQLNWKTLPHLSPNRL